MDRVQVVEEGPPPGGMAEAVITGLAESCDKMPATGRVTGADSYIPLGPAAKWVLPSEDEIVTAALKICSSPDGSSI